MDTETELKQCSKCKEYKELDLFSNHKSTKDGKQSYCKSCDTANHRAYREANPEKKAAYQRAYREENKEKAKAYWRAYYAANPEKVAEKNRAYREANPEKVAEIQRAYREANPEKVAERQRVCRYNLTNERYQKLLEEQNNRCEICLKPFAGRAAHIDHDHVCCPGTKSCGKCIRGLLCGNCNKMLGFSEDGAEILQSAMNYLDKYNQMQYTNQSEENTCSNQI
jgi:hypothetical protein